MYEAYPGSSSLPIDAPDEGESIRDYRKRIGNDFGDTLFLFILTELSDLQDDTATEQVKALVRACMDILAVVVRLEAVLIKSQRHKV